MHDENLTRVYSDRTYVTTTMVRHSGTTVAFAMDAGRRVFYTVLDLEQASAQRGPLDSRYWNEEPAPVPFPGELVEVPAPGAAPVSGVLRMPRVRNGGRTEAAAGVPLPVEERDPFLSTTARLSALAPLQVVSDGRYILVLRQGVDAGHEDAVFHADGGVVSADRATASSGTAATAVPVVDGSLLCDRFVLVGSVLKPVVEVRYQRSRSKLRGASESDTLGTRDMEGNPFFEPTAKLSFVAPVQDGAFTALLLPTAVAGRSRWQVFAANRTTGRVEGYNCAQGADGLFDVAGAQLYTSPDPRYASAVLERGPGTCPHTKRPLVPVPASRDRAGTALRFGPGTGAHVLLPSVAAPSPAAPSGYTVEAWVRPAAASGTIVAHHAGTSPSSTFSLELDAERKLVADLGGTRVVSDAGVPLGTYTHVAAVFDGVNATVHVGGVRTGTRAVTAVPDAWSAASVGARLVSGAPQAGFTGDVDEVRIWERARTEAEFGDRGLRLSGIEPGLALYCRFDEGAGTAVGDHTRALRDGTAHNGPVWVASDAPAGDGPGLSRDVFGFDGRTVSTGLAAAVYSQQEPATSGYGAAVGHEKRQTRLLLACGTSGPAPAGGSADRSYIAAVDLAVARDGRLATVPSVISLAEAGRPGVVGDPAAVAAAQATLDAAQAALDADRRLAAQIPQTQASIDTYEQWFGPTYVMFFRLRERLQEQEAAQRRLGARQAAVDAAEDALMTLSGGTRGGGDTVVAMPLVSTDRQGLTAYGALLAFAWTENAPFVLDGATGDVVLYFRGAAGQLFSAYYSTLVTRATRSLDLGGDRLEFVARDTAVRVQDFSVGISADVAREPGSAAAADHCTVTVTCGSRTETYARVPRAAASVAAVLNGSLPPGALLGTVLSVKDRLVELAAPLPEPLAAGSRVLVGGRVREADAAAPAGATTFTVAGETVTAATGSQVTTVPYDYAEAVGSVPGVELSSGSQIVAVTRVGAATTAVPDGVAQDAGDGVGPHWRGHAPGRAPVFDGTTRYLAAADGADFATGGDLTLEAWLNPAAAAGTVLHAAGPATPYGLALRGVPVLSGLALEEDGEVECGDRLSLTGTGFTIEMWAYRQAAGRDDPLLTMGAGLVVGIDRTDRLCFGGDFGSPGQAELTWAVTTATVPAQEWHHWAVVHDATAGTRRVYRDGVELACTSETGDAVAAGTFGGMSFAGAADTPTLRLGRRAQGGGVGSRVCLDEVRVWTGARTAEQIGESMLRRLRGREDGLLAYWQFSNGSTADRSGHGHDGTLVGPYRRAISPLDGYAPVATVGSQTFTLAEGVPLGDWSHIALAFRQHWAMAMDGGGHLDAGGPDGLNLLGDLTIEAGVCLDTLGVVHGLVGKGVLEGGAAGTSVPYALSVEADGQLAFSFEKGGGGKDGLVTVRSGTKLKAGVFTRVAVTRKGGHNARGGVAVRLYVDGAPVGPQPYVFEGAAPVGNDENCDLGRNRRGRTAHHLRGLLTEVRIWSVARDEKQLHAAVTPKAPGLTAWWAFPEKEGAVTADACDTFPAKVRGARRVPTPDPEGNLVTFYTDGTPQPASTAPVHAQPSYTGEAHATLGGRWHAGALTDGYTGTVDEVRIWRSCRTREQILDNMFARLRGEAKDLVAYFPFDGASTQEGATVRDFGPRGNDLRPSPDAPRNTISGAPISADAAEVRSALTGVGSTFNARVDATPAASEYGDLQADADGRAFGVMKRAYAFVRHGRWELLTGFKTGELTTTWVGQAQFDPQLIGYLEGAPPMPSENMVWGTADSYAEKASVSFVQADSVSNTISNDERRSLDASGTAKVDFSVNDDTSIVAAPLGVGTAKAAVKAKVGMTVEAQVKFSNGWATNLGVSQSSETTRTSGVVLTGQWEEDAETGQVSPGTGRRWVPANTGFAIVQSATADLYALRLAHSGVLVAYRMIPNADVPRDWNVIAFPINPRYTKQGTLDGVIGFAPTGTSGALQPFPDPAFPHAGDGGEYSYYRPREAYAIKRRIQREEQQLQSFYESVSTESATFAAHNPVRDQADRVLGGMMGGVGTGLAADRPDPADVRRAASGASRRHMANTYVWTAAGGLFSETMSTTDQVTQVTTGDYSVSGSVTVGGYANIEAGPVGVNISGSVSLGGGYAVTRSRTKEARRTFSLEVSAEPGRDLQKREGDKPVFDIARNPVLVPGRVDAYRFMTFYLDSSTDNYEDFYGKVVDPEWLDRSTGPDARALRQTRQGDRKPPCWRVLHRVTFVSRVQDTATTTPSLARAMGTLGITSDYHLMKQLEPHLAGATADRAALVAAARTTIATRFPALAPYTDSITERVTAYYNLPADAAAALVPAGAVPAPPPEPAPVSTLTTTTPTVAAGQTITLRYSTPAATLAARNWIGLYRDGTAPGSGEAAAWEYAPDADGRLDLTAGGGLAPGGYRAWYLHDDGYTPLAGPLVLTLT